MKVGADKTGLFFRSDPTSTILFFEVIQSIHDLVSATPMRLFTRLDPKLKKNDFKGLDIH